MIILMFTFQLRYGIQLGYYYEQPHQSTYYVRGKVRKHLKERESEADAHARKVFTRRYKSNVLGGAWSVSRFRF